MRVSLEYLGDKKFQAKTSKSGFILDCKEITPVEYFATGLIGCTGIDIVMFASKDGYEIRDYRVEADIVRNEGVPYKFNEVEIKYSFNGDFEDIKAKRYILSSLESYCTTVNSIRDSVKVFYTIEYNGKVIADRESILSGTVGGGEAVLEDGFGGACCS
jgi:putative redox protein